MSESIEILLAEDNMADVVLISKAFEGIDWGCRIHVVQDGMAAMGFLRQHGLYTEAPRPDLVILDHNLPKTSGREIFLEMREDSALSTIPVVILSGSEGERGAMEKLGLPPGCYIVKPNTFWEYTEIARQVREIWRASSPER